MAESKQKDENPGNSWWGGWLQTAKETSASAIDFVKRDLGEFTCTVQSDTEHVVSVTSNTVKETLKAENTVTAKSRMKEGFNTLFQGITKALTIPPDDEGQKTILVVSSESVIYDRSKIRLHAIQVDPDTYLQEPNGHAEHFIEWCKYFDIETKKGDISELLVSKVEVRALYTKLVPAEVSQADFWQRYFYKLHQMSLDEARKQALIKRAERSRHDNNSINDDWGSGDEENMEIVELPPNPLREPEPIFSPQVQLASVSSPLRQAEQISQQRNLNLETQQTIKHTENDGNHLVTATNVENNIKQNLSSKTETDDIKFEQIDKKVSLSPIEIEKEPVIIGIKQTSVIPKMSEFTDKVPVTTNNIEINIDKADTTGEVIDSSQTDSQIQLEAGNNFENFRQTPDKSEHVNENQKNQVNLKVENVVLSQSEPLCVLDAVKGKQEEVTASVDILPLECVEDIKTKEKDGMVIVGPDRISPTSDSSGNKDPSTEDDWDKDFDVDVTEEDLKAAEELAKKMGEELDVEDDDWENWE